MNLEFLFWASKISGDPKYKEIAISHANTTMVNHFRDDYSSYHVVDYNGENGKVIARMTHQGYSDSSEWARGQSWAVYGYTLCYRETKDRKYLNQAYGLKYMETNNPAVFPNAPVSALELEDDEYGLAMPQVWQEDGIYKMIYSIRSRSKGYRVAYAESEDGITFKRVTNMIDGLDVSKDGFDSEMICFGKIVRTDKETYMFYCGNHYGREGLGVAKMMD